MQSNIKLSDIRTLVRRDLMDESSPYRFNDNQIDRAIEKAKNELSLFFPEQKTATIATTNNTSSISLTTISNWLSIDKVEFPTGSFPKVFVNFEVWGNTLYMLDVIGTGGNAIIYYATSHTIDGSGSTLSPELIDVLVIGASAYAILSLAQYSVNVINIGGEDVDINYMSWGNARLNEFKSLLQLLYRKNKYGDYYLKPYD